MVRAVSFRYEFGRARERAKAEWLQSVEGMEEDLFARFELEGKGWILRNEATF